MLNSIMVERHRLNKTDKFENYVVKTLKQNDMYEIRASKH